MKIKTRPIYTVLFLLFASTVSYAEQLELSPNKPLTLAQVEKVARDNEQVTINAQGWKNIEAGHQVVMQAALNNQPVYGLTVGVGWNKDKPVFQELQGKKVLSQDLLALSAQFNRSSLRAHAAGLGDPLPIDVVRAAMLIRLNTMLKGETGAQKAVAEKYLEFLNLGITPVVPSRGSVGEADITLASHIGLAMIGEWDVFYQGKHQPAKAVLQQLHIAPLDPIGKDFLAILSNNSLMAGKASLLTMDLERLMKKQIALFALMLESYNGNLAPFSESAVNARPFPAMVEIAKQIREQVKGSDLWQTSENRALQDPLSFRTIAYTLGVVRENLQALSQALQIQINASDDNPLVLLQAPNLPAEKSQFQRYKVLNGKNDQANSGAIYPTANFNFLPIANKVEYLNQSLAKLAEVMTQQLIRLENPEFTDLARFLSAPSNQGHAFGAIQKPFVETNIRIKQLAQPLSFSSVTLAGNIEDTATMSGITLDNLQQIIEGINEIDSFQLLHASQAVDLRSEFHLGEKSQALYNAYRQQVPFIAQDRSYTPLLSKGLAFWKNYSVQ